MEPYATGGIATFIWISLVSGEDLAWHALRNRAGRSCFRGGGQWRNGRRGGDGGPAAIVPTAFEVAAGCRQHLGVAPGERQQEDQQEGADHLGSHRHRAFAAGFVMNSPVLRGQRICDARDECCMDVLVPPIYSPEQQVSRITQMEGIQLEH